MSTVCDSYNLSGNYRPVESLQKGTTPEADPDIPAVHAPSGLKEDSGLSSASKQLQHAVYMCGGGGGEDTILHQWTKACLYTFPLSAQHTNTCTTCVQTPPLVCELLLL